MTGQLAGQPSRVEKTLTLDIIYKLFNQIFFIPNLLLGTIDIFTDFDLAWGSQGHHKANHIGFIFSHAFYVIWMKFHVMMK